MWTDDGALGRGLGRLCTSGRAIPKGGPALLLVGAFASLLATTAAAKPAIELATSSGPHYVGVPVEVHVQAGDLAPTPEPTCRTEPVASGALQLVGIVPRVSTSVQIVNGQVYRSESAEYTCQFQFTAGEPGSYRLGPFHLEQGAVALDTEPLTLRIQAMPVDPQIKVRVLLPEKPAYIGQHLPVTVEWWLDEKLKDRIAGYQIRSELFDRDDTFRFVDSEAPVQGQQSLEISTVSGKRSLDARVEQRSSGGRRYLVVAAERMLVPLRAGSFELAPATVHVDEVTRWRRDFFGGRKPAETRRIYSRDTDRVLIVKPAPTVGRPDSFAGAVGRGFSIDVSADRSVVQLGDPITLTVTIRGDGNLASAGLPRLDVDGGLSPEHFRLPESDVAGEALEEAKVFRVSLRVLDDAVREVPALAYSYFDPELGEYRTARSRPIALSVRPAQIISAADVQGRANEASTSEPDEDPREGEAVRGSFSLTGADLSIERDPALLLRSQGGDAAFQTVAYGSSIAALLGAVWLRRRRDLSPELRRRHQVFAVQAKRIAAAGSLPQSESVGEIAAALREIIAAAPALRSQASDALIADCDEVIYAPAGADAETVPSEHLARAKALLDSMKAVLDEKVALP
jgi:hypothetical protein